MILLKGRGVSKHFGGVKALDNVNFEIYKGEILGLIGPNGAGKTTLVNVISCLYRCSAGEIFFKEKKINHLKPYHVAHLGIARTFQTTKIFEGLSVRENVAIGTLFSSKASNSYRISVEQADEVLDFVGLKERDRKPDELPVGQRRLLEIARAVAMKPEILLLDEVLAGMEEKETQAVMELILRLKERGITIIYIEHVMKAIMNLCTRIMVLQNGKKIAEGTPLQVSNNPDVIRAYLGTRYAERYKSASLGEGLHC